MNNKQIIALIIIFSGVLMLIFSGVYSSIEYGGNIGTTKVIDTNCYDRYSNEIEGLVCKQEVIDEYNLIVVLSSILGVLFIFFGIGGLVFANSESDGDGGNDDE